MTDTRDFHEDTPADPVVMVQTLFVRHTPALRGFLYAIVPDFAHVDDVVQETFLTVTRKAREFEPGTNFLAWICAIGRYKAVEIARSQSRRPRPLADEVLDALCACEPEPEPDDEPRLRLLSSCLEQLAPQARRAVELRYSQAHKPAEIARRLGWTPASVYVALSRARSFLRDCVERRLAQQSGD
ncbi:MAG: sigma-70 family RNA polymerase sigma factor [Gemmataceae bacterium]